MQAVDFVVPGVDEPPIEIATATAPASGAQMRLRVYYGARSALAAARALETAWTSSRTTR